MKEPASTKRSVATRGKATAAKAKAVRATGPKHATTVDEYLAGVPEPARTTLSKIRAVIRAAAPAEAEECISYRIPMFKYKGMLMGFAAFSNHCSVFPGAIVDRFTHELKGYKLAKGTIQFPVDKPLPALLVRKLVKAGVERNERKAK